MAHETRGRRRGGSRPGSRPNADTIRIAGVGPALAPRGVAAWRETTAEAIALPVTVAAVHWLIVQSVASLVHRYGTPNLSSGPQGYAETPLSGLADLLVAPMRTWDGLWYALIAEEGYAGGMTAKAAFWPLFPWLMDLGSRLTGWTADTVGYLIANVCFVVALVLLYRLVALDFDRSVARRTLWAIALFPTALFFTAVYTESLFLMLAVGALLAARLGNWWVAGVVGALAALTRSYGVLLLIPFAILFLQQRRLNVRRWFPDGIGAALPALGPAIFAWHLDRVWDDPLAFVDVQKQWNRYDSNPIDTLRCGIESCFFFAGEPDGATWGWLATLRDNPTWGTVTSNAWRADVGNSDTLELTGTLLFLGLAIIGLKVLPLYMSAFVIPGLVIPLYQPSQVHALMSMPRFGLPLFPLFIVLALLFRRRLFALPALALSTLLLVLLTAQFAQWYWVS